MPTSPYTRGTASGEMDQSLACVSNADRPRCQRRIGHLAEATRFVDIDFPTVLLCGRHADEHHQRKPFHGQFLTHDVPGLEYRFRYVGTDAIGAHVLHPSVRGFVLISIPRIAMLFRSSGQRTRVRLVSSSEVRVPFSYGTRVSAKRRIPSRRSSAGVPQRCLV